MKLLIMRSRCIQIHNKTLSVLRSMTKPVDLQIVDLKIQVPNNLLLDGYLPIRYDMT